LWPTPTANQFETKDVGALLARRERVKATGKNGNGFGLTLQQAVAVRMWPTPAARDFRYPNARPYSERSGTTKGEQLPNAVGGPLNPTWVEWLMGFPLGWTDCGPSETRSSRKSPS
jgi:hypothetical protein